MSADAIRLRREVEQLIKVVEEQGKRIAALETKNETKKLSLPSKDAKAN